MNWKKVKKLIIPLIVAKFIIFFIFLFRTEIVTISRDVAYYKADRFEIGNDSLNIKRQKLIRIVRNEGEKGISIVLRGKKNNINHREKDGKITVPMVN